MLWSFLEFGLRESKAEGLSPQRLKPHTEDGIYHGAKALRHPKAWSQLFCRHPNKGSGQFLWGHLEKAGVNSLLSAPKNSR
jgi:hypothetical protein